MKAEITSDGFLVVTAETETESYALKCWWNSYQQPAVVLPASGIHVRYELPAQPEKER